MKNILPCPFCGESEALHVLEIDRQDFRKDVNDRVSRIGKLVYAVECQNCSASGPTGIDFDIRHEIQEEDVMRLKNEAIFEWNARSSIRDKSFEFVNSVLKKLTDANEKIIGDACNHDISFLREIINSKGRYIICAIDSNDERKMIHNFHEGLVDFSEILRDFAIDRIAHEFVINKASGMLRTSGKNEGVDTVD